jgi:glucan biosynthesis protein C
MGADPINKPRNRPVCIFIMDSQLKDERLYYLDWLRVFAVMLLIPYHTGMIFVNWDFHIKNNVRSTGLTIINAFIDNWHMPLFFLLAGASTWFALKKRPAGAYIKERFLRLILPLVFGVLVIVPPQTFYERIQKSGFSGNYFDFCSHLFNGLYPEGNLTWNHLWFLFYLFFISVAVLPLILRWKSGRGASSIESFCKWTAKGHRIFLLFIPLAIIQMTLKVAFPGPQNIVTDWARILFMLFIFLCGVLFYLVPGFREAIDRNLGAAFAIGVAIFAFFIILNYLNYKFIIGYNIPNLMQLGIKSLATWCWIIVLLGFAQRYLNFSNRFLDYANEGVLPIYILHQTIIIILGFYIVETEFSVITKYIFINIISLVLIMAIYEGLVRRFAALRFLLGMRPMPKKTY